MLNCVWRWTQSHRLAAKIKTSNACPTTRIDQAVHNRSSWTPIQPSGLWHTVHELEVQLDISSCWLHNSSRSLESHADLHVSARGTLNAVGDILRPGFRPCWYNEPSGGGQCPIHVARESQQHLDGKSIEALSLLAHLFSRCEGSDYKHLQAIHTIKPQYELSWGNLQKLDQVVSDRFFL